MISVEISSLLKSKCPEMVLGIIACDVVNTKFSEELWNEIKLLEESIRANFEMPDIKNQANIAATRKMYKACGKDPNRYRPSAEALYRRIVKGVELYQISTLVDLINYLSIKTGYSIGAFDADKVQGKVVAGIGEKDEPYEGIGRGVLNIEGLPVIRDEIGGIGTPTSDEVRTAISMDTTKLFMNINAYTGKEEVLPILEQTGVLLQTYLKATNIESKVID